MANGYSYSSPLLIRAPRVELENSLIQLLGTLSPGDRLPPEPDLARQLGVSRAMLREVVTGLVERGLLIRRQGIGTFVASQAPFIDFGLEVLESLDSLAKRKGMETEVLELEIRSRRMTADEIEIFNPIENSANVLEVSRVIAINGKAVAYLVDNVPEIYLAQADVKSSIHGSVYDLLAQKKEIPLSYSRTDILAINADAETSRKLKIGEGTALILLTAQLYTTNGRIVDYSISYFVPGQFKFHVMRRLGRPTEW
ncbi:GntR family transcriptional regulator [Leptolinea tardivitalis]|uniref:GntR family transcriptional regulator n=1 Tax=Leptolinea tardivitalis TaxID=229920 RepID=UPI0009D67B74|nr:GntR family transcriptional regulator [Leptolinea tardivitalis]GAP22854.1 transcriptional regulator, GntR family [Leptolinea tardivitalis]